MVTAKDKLRKLLGPRHEGRSASPPRRPTEATLAENGIDNVLELVGMPVPSVYSAELSEFVFAAGVKLLERERPDIMYLSHHRLHPAQVRAGHRGRQRVLRDDGPLSRDDSTRWARPSSLTADHGMNAKQKARRHAQRDLPAGRARRLDRQGQGARDPADHRSLRRAPRRARLVRDHLRRGRGPGRRWRAKITALAGIEVVLDNAEAAKRFELPPDRIGDLVVVSTRHVGARHQRARATTSRGSTRRCARTAGSRSRRVPLLFNRKVDGRRRTRSCAISTSSTSR